MGVGISASSLSATWRVKNGVGTIAALIYPPADLLAESTLITSQAKYDKLNRIARLDREITKAKADSEGRGMIAVNVMKAVKDHQTLVRQPANPVPDAIVMGAGLPLDLPEAGGYPDIALLRFLSESHRSINIST